MARQARAERTRTSALSAAIDILTTEGYAALSTRAVQEASGLTRGAFLHHFPTREALLAATVDEIIARRAARAQSIIEAFHQKAPPDRLEAAIRTVRELFSGPDFFAEMELWTAARTNHELRESLVPVTERISVLLHRQLADLFGPDIAAHQDFRTLSMLTVELARGLAVNAPVRGNRADSKLLDYWCLAAARMLRQPAA